MQTASRLRMSKQGWAAGASDGMRTVFAVLGIVAALSGGGAVDAVAQQQSDAAAVALQRAIRVELVDGDLPGAIGMYEEIVASYASERGVVARALLHLGDCHDKLDDGQAAATYERVVTDYGDQPDAVAEARQRMQALGQSANGSEGDDFVARRISRTSARNGQDEGSISPDGRHLSIIDFTTGDIAVWDLESREYRRLSDAQPWSGLVLGSVFSPDGRAVAYHWQDWSDRESENFELRVANADGSGVRTLVRASEALPSTPFIQPHDWSADGTWILALAEGHRESKILRVSATDGTFEVIKTLDWRTPEGMSISPDGRYIAYDLPTDQEQPDARDIFTIATDWTREETFVGGSADDAMPVWAPDGNSVVFVSNRSGSYDLWAQPVRDGEPQGSPQLLKASVGRITPLGFTEAGAYYYSVKKRISDLGLARYEAETGTLTRISDATIDTGTGLVHQPSWSPDGKTLAFVDRTIEESSRLNTVGLYSSDSGVGRRVAIEELEYANIGGWSTDGQRLLVFGGEPTGRHSVFWMDVETGARELIFRSDEYLNRVKIAPDGSTIYYRPGSPGVRILARDMLSGENRVILDVGLPQQEVLSPDGSKIAFRFKGQPGVQILEIATGRVDTLPTPIPYTLAWTPDGRHVLFVVSAEADPGAEPEWTPGGEATLSFDVWRVAVDGSEATPTGLRTTLESSLRFHPDGETLTFLDVEGVAEMWVLENLSQMIHGVGQGQ